MPESLLRRNPFSSLHLFRPPVTFKIVNFILAKVHSADAVGSLLNLLLPRNISQQNVNGKVLANKQFFKSHLSLQYWKFIFVICFACLNFLNLYRSISNKLHSKYFYIVLSMFDKMSCVHHFVHYGVHSLQ